jgi:hypothetical protein
MRLNINTAGVQFLATRLPEPRTDRDTGAPRIDKETGLPMFQVQVAALDSSGGEVLAVSVPGQPAGITIGSPVSIEGLVAIPWSQGDRSGVAYRATALRGADARPGKSAD